MADVIRTLAVLAGIVLAAGVGLSAVRTVILPRNDVVIITRFVFVNLRRIFDLFAKEQRSYDARDRVMALYGPLGLLILAGAWAFLVMVAFTMVFWGLGVDPLREAAVMSGSSFTTLGFAAPRNMPTQASSVAEAVLGL
ncbi:MAG TPA: hypothetical protein VGM93_02185, partial [Acidimicrobiales bacterium]